MKTKLGIVILACVALFMPACGSSPQNPIVGKWEAGDGAVKAEFAKDATAKLTMFGRTVQGTYKVNGGDELEWTLNGKTTKYKLKVAAKELELTGDGQTITYKKL